MDAKPTKILNFWYSKPIKAHWFKATLEIDREIKNRYEKVWEAACAGLFDSWQQSPEGCLALAIILDQFPLNMFRGQAKSFQTEARAIEVSMTAIDKGFDEKLAQDKLPFLLMPLMHSESIRHQNLSVKLFAKHQLVRNLKFAKHHRAIVKKYGRFPHRNAVLGRESSDGEREYLMSKKVFSG